MEVKIRLGDEDRVVMSRLAGRQGKTFSQAVREAVALWNAAQLDGVARVGSYWVVPQEKAALVRELLSNGGQDVVRE